MTAVFTISDLAAAFNVTTRTIRYYEEVGLIQPDRNERGRRIFTKKEKARLHLIFRGKKYGFHLEEIKEMIQLFDVDPSGRQQLKKTIEYGNEKIEEVEARIEELTLMKGEMVALMTDFQAKLNELEEKKDELT